LIGVTVFMSRDHLMAALHFARQCYSVEARSIGTGHSEEHRSYVIGSVLSAVAFLEATVNEIFVEPRLFAMSPELQRIFRKLWDCDLANSSVLVKYEIALLLKGAPEFARGQQPFQDVDLVIKLRNALVHYKPEWQPLEQPQRMEKLLRNKFTLNPLAGNDDVFFPGKCLSYGCAKWAVRSVLAFGNEFFKRFGMPQYFGGVEKGPTIDLP
jgi:hypothetical protein